MTKMICTGPQCDRPVVAKALCPVHYHQMRNKGKLWPIKPRRAPGPCDFVGCDKPRFARGYCVGHDNQIKGGRALAPLRPQRRPHEVRVRDSSGRKQCTACLEFKPEAEFTRSGKAHDGLLGRCKQCIPPTSGGNRDYRLRLMYNIGLKEFDEILASQGKACVTCGITDPGKRGWCVDHDHACCKGTRSCGECIRGILCSNCNCALGYAQDNPQTLRNMIAYLAVQT